MKLEEIVVFSVKYNVFDLYLCNFVVLCWWWQGRLQFVFFFVLDIVNLFNDWFDVVQLLYWQEYGQIDFVLILVCGVWLCVSVFVYMCGILLVLCFFFEQCLCLDMFGVLFVLSELLVEESGLLLVIGVMGSGKLIILVVMVGYFNQYFDGYILMFEDLVEFIYYSECCLIQQWEVGCYCFLFVVVFCVVLCQDLDVILFGELCDSEIICLVLIVVEIGYLVMVILYICGVVLVVERLIDVFLVEEKDQVCSQFVGSLCVVLV